MIQLLSNDSGHSTSSTLTVEESRKQSYSAVPLPLAPKNDNNGKKRVRFNEDSNSYHDRFNQAQNEEDCECDTWYSAPDYQRFKSESFNKALSVRDSEDLGLVKEDQKFAFSSVMEALFRAIAKVQFVLEDVSELVNEDMDEALAMLYTNQAGGDLDCIGLEFHIARAVKTETKERRACVQDVAYDIQSEYDRGLWEREDMENELRESCCNYSQTVCLFAQLMARAQYMAE